jgi:hypothetical protein
MRLIDVDAEIARIEEEIMKLTKAIVRWQARKFEESTLYDIDAKIQELQNNRTDCRVEIRTLRNYKTAFDVEKVVEELENLREVELHTGDMCDELGNGDGESQYNDGVSQGRYEAFIEAIKIVKRGGRND